MVGAYVRSSIFLTIPAGVDGGVFASCDTGDIAMGGGFTMDEGPGTLDVYEARPADPAEDPAEPNAVPSSFLVRATNDTFGDRALQAWVMCMDVTP